MAFYTEFQGKFIKSGNTYTIDIEKDGSGGTTTIEKMMPSPIIIKQRGQGRDKESKVINGSELEFNFYSSAADAGQFDGIFTADWKVYRLSFYRDSTLIWQGWIQPDNFKREFITSQYEISLSAIDGLSTLKDIDFLDFTAGTPFEDVASGIVILKRCLEHLEIDLEIKGQINIIHNAWMTTSDCVLTDIDYDCRRFTKINDGRETPEKSDVVIERILELFGVELRQIEGAWWVISKHETLSPLYTYDWATLTPVRTASNDLELDISGYDFRGRGIQSLSPPLKAHEVTFLNVNLGSNDIPAMDVANWTKTDLLSFGTSGGVGTMTSRQPVSGAGYDTGTDLKITSDPFELAATGEDTVSIQFSVKMPTFSGTLTPIFNMYLEKNGVNIPADDFQSNHFVEDSDYSTYQRVFPISQNATDDDYTLVLRISGDLLWSTTVMNIKDVESQIFFANGAETANDNVYISTNTDTPATKITEQDVWFADAEDQSEAGVLQVGASGVTYSWKRYGKTEALKIANLMGLQLLTDNAFYKEYLNLTIIDVGDLVRPYHKLTINSREYRILSFSKNYYNWETNIELEEILTTDPANTLTIQPLITQDGKSTGGASSASPLALTINDSTTSPTSLWSSSKINTELDGKEDADSAFVKSDVNETITGAWRFNSGDAANTNIYLGATDEWRLLLEHSGGLRYLHIYDDLNNDHIMTWRYGGYVGINNTSPAEALDIVGTAKATTFNEDGTLLANKYSLKTPTIITKTASDTLIASDNGKVILFNTGSSVNLTMGLSLGAGFNVQVINIHPTGVVTLLAGSATLNAKAAKLSSQWGGCTIFYTATSTAVALGDLTVA